jgi:hypothetical protein
MLFQERVQILTDAEQANFYGMPNLTANDQRYVFALNNKERGIANKFRVRSQHCMFVASRRYRIDPTNSSAPFKRTICAWKRLRLQTTASIMRRPDYRYLNTTIFGMMLFNRARRDRNSRRSVTRSKYATPQSTLAPRRANHQRDVRSH